LTRIIWRRPPQTQAGIVSARNFGRRQRLTLPQPWHTSSATGPQPIPTGAVHRALSSSSTRLTPTRTGGRGKCLIHRGYLLPRGSAELSRRVEKVVGYPPLSEMSSAQRREFQEALLDADASRTCGGSGRRRSSRANRTGRSSSSPAATSDSSPVSAGEIAGVRPRPRGVRSGAAQRRRALRRLRRRSTST
jgi:hypothetical protein